MLALASRSLAELVWDERQQTQCYGAMSGADAPTTVPDPIIKAAIQHQRPKFDIIQPCVVSVCCCLLFQ